MNPTSGLYPLNEDQIAERAARMARRDDREYREYLREEQRSQPGCPAREVGLDQPIQATRWVDRLESHVSHYLALVERGLFALAAILLGWYFLQHAITA